MKTFDVGIVHNYESTNVLLLYGKVTVPYLTVFEISIQWMTVHSIIGHTVVMIQYLKYKNQL